MANATATEKEKIMKTPTGGVPDLALMLTGDNKPQNPFSHID
jgi:hypothetical protein